MKYLVVQGLFAIILFLHSSKSQHINDDKNNILEWYYNINQNGDIHVHREKRQSRFDEYDNDDEWYVFDEVVPQNRPNSQRSSSNSNNNQFGWFQRQPGTFGQPNTIPTARPNRPTTTTARAPFPNAGPPRPSRCIQMCSARTTSEYNPVCGTDGVTYDTLQKLECAASCGMRVQFQRLGRCSAFLPVR